MGLLSMIRERSLVAVPATVTSEDVEFSAEYERVAAKVGVLRRPIQTTSAKLIEVLKEEGIDVYPLAKVEKYLDSKGYWYWFPLNHNTVRVDEFNRETAHDHVTIFGGVKRQVFNQPIPLPVLLTTERILDRLGDQVSFWVAATGKDPFLAVTLNSDESNKLFVIERWDEPSFRG